MLCLLNDRLHRNGSSEVSLISQGLAESFLKLPPPSSPKSMSVRSGPHQAEKECEIPTFPAPLLRNLTILGSRQYRQMSLKTIHEKRVM